MDGRNVATTLPWVEKYRPAKLSHLAKSTIDGPETLVVTQCRSMLSSPSSQLPHLLLHGPPGTGKTSTVSCLVQELWSDAADRVEYVLELNASLDRGIETIREQVKTFASRRAPPHDHPPRLVILDEADHLTGPAQDALRVIMEQNTRQTRFALICNNINAISMALRSRCTLVRFPSLAHSTIGHHLQDIAREEKMDYETSALCFIVYASGGDMRKAIGHLQAMQSADGPGKRTVTHARLAIGQADDQDFKRLDQAILLGSFGAIRDASQTYLANGWITRDYLEHALLEMAYDKDTEELSKANAALALADSDMRIAEGVDESLELVQLLSRLSEHIEEPRFTCSNR